MLIVEVARKGLEMNCFCLHDYTPPDCLRATSPSLASTSSESLAHRLHLESMLHPLVQFRRGVLRLSCRLCHFEVLECLMVYHVLLAGGN